MNCVARHDIKDTALGTVSEAYPHLILEARAKPRRVLRALWEAVLTLCDALRRGFRRRWARA
jgi:hypothetical protein